MFLNSLVVSLTAVASVQATQYGYNFQFYERDNELVAAQFPEPNMTLLSPYFLNPETIEPGFSNSTQASTSQADVDHFLQSLAARNEWMTYQVADFKSEEGRSIPMVYLSSKTSFASNSTKIRVWLQSYIHGNEPAAEQALLALLGKMDANQTWAARILQNIDVFAVPRPNPDGAYYFQRLLASNFDPNRDHVKLARQPTRDLKALFSAFSPHIAIDMHEFSAGRPWGKNRTLAADSLFSAAKNLNIHPDIRDLAEGLFAKSIGGLMDERGFRWEPYVTKKELGNGTVLFEEAGSDAKIGRNAMGLTQCVSFLSETRGIGVGDQDYKRRTATGLTLLEAVLQTAADEHERVYSTVEGAIQKFIEGSDEIVVTDSATVVKRPFELINTVTGEITNDPVDFVS